MSASRFSVVGRIRPKTSQEVHFEGLVIGDENAVRVKPDKKNVERVIEQTESDLELLREVAEKNQELALMIVERENLYNALQVTEAECEVLKKKSVLEKKAKENAERVIEETKSDLKLLVEEVARKNQVLRYFIQERNNLHNALQVTEAECEILKKKFALEKKAKKNAERVIEQTKSDLKLLREEVAEKNQELALIIKEKENLYNALQIKEEEFQTLKQKSLMENLAHELEIDILSEIQKCKEIEAKANAKRVIEQTKSDLKLLREEVTRKNQELALIIEEKENLYNALQVKEEEIQTLKQKSLMKNVIHELEMKILIKSQKHKEIEIKKEAEEVAEKMRMELSCVQQQLQYIKISFAEKEQKLSSTIQNLKNDVKKLSFERFNLRDELDQRNS